MVSLVLAQTESPVSGIVSGEDGKPIAGVLVYGSLGKCCPSDREKTSTDKDGSFYLKKPGAVVHISGKDLQPQAVIIKPSPSELHVTLGPLTDKVAVPACGMPARGQKQIGWGKYGLRFRVPKHSVQILGGKPDVDYVQYIIRPKAREAYLKLLFGGYAISMEPSDEQFITSSSFVQVPLVALNGKVIGMDSRGQLSDGRTWRQTVVTGEGGLIYNNASAEDRSLFDQIANSLCEVPYPSQ